MSEDGRKSPVDRKRRIDRLKKGILTGLFVGILVPWVLCAALFVCYRSGNQRLAEYSERIGRLEDFLLEQSAMLSKMEAALQVLEEREEDRAAAQLQETLQAEEHGDEDEPGHKVYLTFDDGPSVHTGEILDILKEYNAKATFFVVGKESEADKALIRRIVEEGHTLGMHSYSHNYYEIYSSKEAFAADFDKLQGYLRDLTGVESRIYRFPGGSSNSVTNRDIHEFIEYLDEKGVVYFDWNVASGDAVKEGLSAETIFRNSTENLHEHSSSVILLHDAQERETTVEALPMILEKILQMEDTGLYALTEDSEPVQHVKAGAR